jgi:predicted secreted hydrolase
MKSRSRQCGWLSAVLIFSVIAFAQQWQTAQPGYRYEFPRDHFNHPDYQTEWWYYTGNLHAADGHRFGFELTFFRFGIHLPKRVVDASAPAWLPDELYLAHLALSDIEGGQFYHTERLTRAGPGLAGVTIGVTIGQAAGQPGYWNGNWQVRWKSFANADQQLQAVCDRFTLHLDLHAAKPAVVNGENGVSQKGPQAASHYISFTRLQVGGTLAWNGQNLKLDGIAWMDHEFFTEAHDGSLAGWDWFSIQLENNEELMLYRLRLKSGQPDPYSSGTYVDSKGSAHFLQAADFALQPGGDWRSPSSGATYPTAWSISVPRLGLTLTETTALKNQELASNSAVSPSYWEGAVTYSGTLHAQPIRGVGYLEMTGYDRQIWLGARQ